VISVLSFGLWDWVLLAIVSLQAAMVAYLYDPKWKALILTLPIPFTCAALAVGQDVNTYNVIGLAILILFIFSVQILHYQFEVSIYLSILVGILVYSGTSFAALKLIPSTNVTFWYSCLVIFLLSSAILAIVPVSISRGHRTSLPVLLKLPILVCVILSIIAVKKQLQGFVTVFPMIALITAYEARHSLCVISRQILVMVLILLPMMIACYMTQSYLGLGKSLVVGWIVFCSLLFPVLRLTNSLPASTESDLP